MFQFILILNHSGNLVKQLKNLNCFNLNLIIWENLDILNLSNYNFHYHKINYIFIYHVFLIIIY